MPSFYVTSKFYVKEIKGKYYVYSIEKGDDGKQRHHYIAPLEKIIETYVSIGGVGDSPTRLGVLGGVPLKQASQACGPGSNPGRGTNFYGDSGNELKGV